MTSRKPALATAVLAFLTLTACGSSGSGEADPDTDAATDAAVAPEDLGPPPPPEPVGLSDRGVRAALRADYPDEGTLFATATADLDGDGSDEILAYPYGPGACGTGGCNLIVLTREGEAYRTVAQTSVTQEPIRLLATSTNGWRDLSVGIGGGGREAAQVRLQFDGKAYPDNPTTLPAAAKVDASEGIELIGDPLQGAPLPPG